jgi:hypothetical protein
MAIVVVLCSSGCALQLSDIKKTHPDGTEEIDKSFRLGTPDWSDGKEMSLIKVM